MISIDKPIISVIIPVYNGERYFAACLDSLAAQTYGNFEAIIVNDGSTDGSNGIIGDFCAKDKRFAFLEKRNEGQGPARNLGFKSAKGEYIYFLDADDWLHPDAFQNMVSAAERLNAEALYLDHEVFYGDEIPKRGHIVFRDEREYGPRRAMMAFEAMPWLYFFKKSVLDRSGVRFPAYFHEDEAEIYRIVSYCKRIYRVSGSVYLYRKHPESTTGLTVNKRTADIIKVVRRFIELAETYPAYSLEFTCKAQFMISNYVVAWGSLDEAWAKVALEEAIPIKLSLDSVIEDNPYRFVREDTIAQIHDSLFWKMSSPLRFVIKSFKRFRRTLQGHKG